ncbi:MAG: hypothetical protein OXH99_12170 [Bryobacterales bacterium]|nr:hypothetical protein [Bryobacterales bacterium]
MGPRGPNTTEARPAATGALAIRGVVLHSAVMALLLAGLPLAAPGQGLPSDPADSPADRYVGSKACAGCHQALHDTFVASAMGSSMAPVGESIRPLVASARPVVNERLNRRFVVEERPDGFYQRESEASPSEKPPFDSAHRLAYVIGSGVNGFSYLVRRGDHLVQAPISFYARRGAWGLSPGYELARPGEDYGFNRTIHAACLQCHAGRPLPSERSEGLYEDPPFAEVAIGCENCHGPGGGHVDARLAERDFVAGEIVDPLALPPRLAENICMNCHQGGDARILQPGRGHFDFLPGTWLNETVAVLKLPMDPASPREADLLEHNASMALSRCYLATEGELTCFSCHRIHDQPSEEAKDLYYRERCLQCHQDSSCTLDAAARSGNTCQGCHMPRRDVAEISHSSLTSHRIVKTPGQPFPPEAFDQTAPDLPELVHVNRPPGAGAESLPLMVRFRAFGELLSRRPDFSGRYLELLAEAAERHGDDPLVLAALGRKAKLDGRSQEAVAYLEEAIEAGPQPPSTYEDLTALLVEAGREEDSLPVLVRAVEAWPFNPRLRKMLALRYINLKRYREASETIRRFVELFPEDDFMRGLQRQIRGLPVAR